MVKDHKTLLYAFELIQRVVNSHLTIIGEGDEEANVRNIIANLKLENRVTILKHLPYIELPSVYHRSHILLHTSLSEGEAVVVSEAMSCGVLVCGTLVGIIADLSDQCCVGVATRDFQSLAEKVIELLNSPELQNSMRSSGREWAKTHSLDWTVQQYELLYINN